MTSGMLLVEGSRVQRSQHGLSVGATVQRRRSALGSAAYSRGSGSFGAFAPRTVALRRVNAVSGIFSGLCLGDDSDDDGSSLPLVGGSDGSPPMLELLDEVQGRVAEAGMSAYFTHRGLGQHAARAAADAAEARAMADGSADGGDVAMGDPTDGERVDPALAGGAGGPAGDPQPILPNPDRPDEPMPPAPAPAGPPPPAPAAPDTQALAQAIGQAVGRVVSTAFTTGVTGGLGDQLALQVNHAAVVQAAMTAALAAVPGARPASRIKVPQFKHDASTPDLIVKHLATVRLRLDTHNITDMPTIKTVLVDSLSDSAAPRWVRYVDETVGRNVDPYASRALLFEHMVACFGGMTVQLDSFQRVMLGKHKQRGLSVEQYFGGIDADLTAMGAERRATLTGEQVCMLVVNGLSPAIRERLPTPSAKGDFDGERAIYNDYELLRLKCAEVERALPPPGRGAGGSGHGGSGSGSRGGNGGGSGGASGSGSGGRRSTPGGSTSGGGQAGRNSSTGLQPRGGVRKATGGKGKHGGASAPRYSKPTYDPTDKTRLDRLTKEGKCWECEETGHSSFKCPTLLR